MLRTYEALFIVNPTLRDDEIQTVTNGVVSLISQHGGVIVRSETWGKRKLAYKVKHYTEGCYVLVRFQAAPSFIARLDNHFRLEEAVIRHLVVYFDEKTLQLEEEQKKRVEAEIQAGIMRRPRRTEEEDDEEEGVAVRAAGRRAADDEMDEEEEEE